MDLYTNEIKNKNIKNQTINDLANKDSILHSTEF